MFTEIPNSETESSADTTMIGILRAVSLFIPPFQAHKRSELARKVKLISFQKCYDSISSQSLIDSLDLCHILQQTFHKNPNCQSHLALLIGHQAQDSKKVVVGAYFPNCTQAPAAKEGKTPERMGKSRIASPLLLFQLQPSFSLFRWNGEGSISSSQANDSATDLTNHPNCIGDPTQSKVGIEIDPVTGQATFLQGIAITPNRMSGVYEEITTSRRHDGPETIIEDQQEQRTTFTVTRIAIFNVEGGPSYDYTR